MLYVVLCSSNVMHLSSNVNHINLFGFYQSILEKEKKIKKRPDLTFWLDQQQQLSGFWLLALSLLLVLFRRTKKRFSYLTPANPMWNMSVSNVIPYGQNRLIKEHKKRAVT